MRRWYLLFLIYITAYSFQSVSGEDDGDWQIYWTFLLQACCSMLACNIKLKKQIGEMRTCISPLLQKKKLRHRKGKKLAQGHIANKEFGSFTLQDGLWHLCFPLISPSSIFSFLHLFVVQVFHGDFGKVSIRYGPSFFISQNSIWRQISSVIWAERI